MKIKRILALIFNLILVWALMMPTFIKAGAEGVGTSAITLDFSLTVDGQPVIMAEEGDVITVTFTMKRTDSEENYALNTFQNYIIYDRDFFEYVADSVVCYDSGSAQAIWDPTSISYGEIIQCQNMANAYLNTFVFCTFQLKVIGTEGSGMISGVEIYAFDSAMKEIIITQQPLQVLYGDGCMHTIKTKVEAYAAVCGEQGWNAYYDCNTCDAYFAEDGVTLIPGIPYTQPAHVFGTDVVFDETGHWYECIYCAEKHDYGTHSGGTATCISKAVCDVCGQEYGELNAKNHAGETVVKNETSTSLGGGYTGDVYCADCGEMIEQGKSVSVINFGGDAWWSIMIIPAALILLLLVVFIILELFSALLNS